MQTIDMFIDEFQDEVKSSGMNPLFVPSEYFKGAKKLAGEFSDER